MDRSKWEYKKLEDICTSINAGGTPSRGNAAYWNGNIPWVKIKDMNSKYVSTTEEFITEEGLNNSSAKVFEPGTILYSIFATIGAAAILNIRATTNQAIAGIVLGDEHNRDFFYYYLTYLKSYFETISKGVAQNNINLSVLRNQMVYVPSLEDQQRIVAELDCLNEMIALKQEQLKEFDKLAQSIFYDMFGDPVTNEKGWELSKLGKIGELGRGVSKHRPRNAPELLGGTMPLIQTGDVANAEMYITDYNATYSELGVKQSKIWKAGTLCITIAATIGKCAILSFDACFPDSVVGFSTNDELTNNEYIYFIFMSLQKILEQNAPAVAQKNINLAVLNALDIPLPPLALQQQFAEKIQAIEAQKELVKRSIAETQQLLDSRMDYYFD